MYRGRGPFVCVLYLGCGIFCSPINRIWYRPSKNKRTHFSFAIMLGVEWKIFQRENKYAKLIALRCKEM